MTVSIKSNLDGSAVVQVNGVDRILLPPGSGLSTPEKGELFGRLNILGTVSQSGGIPTGAIVERGENANGSYTRFADGTQICFGTFPDTAIAANSTVALPTKVFAASFVGQAPVVAVRGAPNASSDFFGVIYDVYASVLGQTSPVIRNGATAQTYTQITYTAIGRWF